GLLCFERFRQPLPEAFRPHIRRGSDFRYHHWFLHLLPERAASREQRSEPTSWYLRLDQGSSNSCPSRTSSLRRPGTWVQHRNDHRSQGLVCLAPNQPTCL